MNTNPTWSFPEEWDKRAEDAEEYSNIPGSFKEDVTAEPKPTPTPTQQQANPAHHEQHDDQAGANNDGRPKRAKHYGPRTCRICLETVQPTTELPTEGILGSMAPAPRVQYISEDPSSGRLIRPCKCKGTQSYVHEGCLNEWRYADTSRERNYFKCPTCGYSYRIERMRWSQWVGSTTTQIVLTLLILWVTVFILGFAADPIFNLYLDPVGAITHPISTLTEPALVLEDEDEPHWSLFEHLLKGLASLGLLGFLKIVFAMSPWHWYNMRNVVPRGGVRARGRGGIGGRDRLENISWHLVLIGVITFLIAVTKGVRAWTRRTLEKAGDRVIDVHGDDDEEEDEPAANPSFKEE